MAAFCGTGRGRKICNSETVSTRILKNEKRKERL